MRRLSSTELVMIAIEIGYKECEQGKSLLEALEKARFLLRDRNTDEKEEPVEDPSRHLDG